MQLARLKEWRESRGLTQRELAAEAEVGEATVARVESGAYIRPNTARKIAEGLGVEVADLLERPPVPAGKAEAPEAGQAGPAEAREEDLEEEREAERRVDRIWEGRAPIEDVSDRVRGEARSGWWDGEIPLERDDVRTPWELAKRYALRAAMDRAIAFGVFDDVSQVLGDLARDLADSGRFVQVEALAFARAVLESSKLFHEEEMADVRERVRLYLGEVRGETYVDEAVREKLDWALRQQRSYFEERLFRDRGPVRAREAEERAAEIREQARRQTSEQASRAESSEARDAGFESPASEELWVEGGPPEAVPEERRRERPGTDR